jgi:hypothetical protein
MARRKAKKASSRKRLPKRDKYGRFAKSKRTASRKKAKKRR